MLHCFTAHDHDHVCTVRVRASDQNTTVCNKFNSIWSVTVPCITNIQLDCVDWFIYTLRVSSYYATQALKRQKAEQIRFNAKHAEAEADADAKVKAFMLV